MPSSNTWAGLSAFLSSAGQSAGKITRQYQADVEDQADRDEKEKERFRLRVKEARALGAKRTGGAKISSVMAALANPMDPEEAVTHLENADPKDVAQASEAIKSITANAPAPLPRSNQDRRHDVNKVKNAIKNALASQESTATDIGAHPKAANGLTAWGKYGIVPELHIGKIGLDPKNPKDVAMWKADEKLQEATMDALIDENYKKSGGDIDTTIGMHYGVPKDKDKKQRLADGREMPSYNEYVAKVKSRMGDVANVSGVERTAGKARQAIDALVSTDFKEPSNRRVKRDEAALGKLYASMTPEEIEQNKDYLDRVTQLAGAGREDYRDEMTKYGNDLNRQTTAAMNAMKLDEMQQTAMLKIKSGVKSLTPEEVKALESRRKLLESMRSQITDFTTRVGSAKAGAREAILKTRPDLAGVEEPGFWDRITGGKSKAVIDDVKIQKKLDLIDSWMMETDRALAGLGGLGQSSADDVTDDENTMLSGGGRKNNPLSNYLTPVGK